MELKKPASAIDRVIIEIESLSREFSSETKSLKCDLQEGFGSLRGELIGGFQRLSEDMNRGFASLDRSFSSVEKKLDSFLEEIEISNKNRDQFLTFILSVIIVFIYFLAIKYLLHIHSQ